MSDCIFCDIVDGKEKCYPIFEDNITKGFLTIHPIAEGHTLVIPKKHYEMIFDIPESELSHVNQVVKMLCLDYKRKLGKDSVSLLVMNGKATNQKIMHFPCI